MYILIDVEQELIETLLNEGITSNNISSIFE